MNAALAGAGFGHGKVILLGEHAVVHGQPALAAGVVKGVRVTARSGSGRLRVPAWELEARAGDGTVVGTALEAMLRPLQALDLDLDAEAGIPARAGLGSSAALSVAVARAALATRPDRGGADGEEAMLATAARGEQVFHGSPSGVDAAAAARGGVGRFTRADGWRSIPMARPFKLCVGLSGRPRNTSALVAGVGGLLARHRSARKLIELMGEVADEGVTAVRDGDISMLASLMNLAHGLLASIGVSTPELETLVHGARAAGADGAKLTGAGGGGAVIALAPGREELVLERWHRDGFGGFVTEVTP